MTEKFYWPVGKKKLTLPRFGNLPVGITRKVRKESEIEQFFQMFEILFKDDPAQLELFDTMTQQEVLDLMTAWQKDSGVEMGESSESSDS